MADGHPAVHQRGAGAEKSAVLVLDGQARGDSQSVGRDVERSAAPDAAASALELCTPDAGQFAARSFAVRAALEADAPLARLAWKQPALRLLAQLAAAARPMERWPGPLAQRVVGALTAVARQQWAAR